MQAIIRKTLKSNEGEEFKISDDIHFIYHKNNKKTYSCFGVIADIGDTEFTIRNVQIDKFNVSDVLTIKFSEVFGGIIHHTDNNWC